jgi:hypothetical protein
VAKGVEARQQSRSGGRRLGVAEPQPATELERLDYIAAMAQQLKSMSAEVKCHTLTALLDLAYREAVHRRDSCR